MPDRHFTTPSNWKSAMELADPEISSSILIRLLETMTGYAQEAGCYKVILDCAESKVEFYEKCGFTKKEVQMVLSSWVSASKDTHAAFIEHIKTWSYNTRLSYTMRWWTILYQQMENMQVHSMHVLILKLALKGHGRLRRLNPRGIVSSECLHYMKQIQAELTPLTIWLWQNISYSISSQLDTTWETRTWDWRKWASMCVIPLLQWCHSVKPAICTLISFKVVLQAKYMPGYTWWQLIPDIPEPPKRQLPCPKILLHSLQAAFKFDISALTRHEFIHNRRQIYILHILCYCNHAILPMQLWEQIRMMICISIYSKQV